MNTRIIGLFSFFLVLLLVLQADRVSAQYYDMEVLGNEAYCPFVPLTQLNEKALSEQLINQLNKNKKWQKLIAQKKMSVGLVDLRSIEDIDFACVNCTEMMYAASLPKIAILLAAMESFEDGTLKETDEILKDLRVMINRSDNKASTRMIDRLSFEKIEKVLTDPKYELYCSDLGGGLWVGKRYASAGKRNPDPIKGLSHAANVTQICRFYYLLARGQLVNEKRSNQMLAIMEDSAIHHKFVNTFDMIAPNAKVYRKSGSWRTFHSDSALVWGKNGRQYILTALVDDAGGERIMRNLVKEVDKLLKSDDSRSLVRK